MTQMSHDLLRAQPRYAFDQHAALPARPIKRLFDLVGALVLVVALAPFFLLTALALLLADGRPLVFSHDRVGGGGRVFGCLKFRTMRRDAQSHLERILASDPALRREWEETQKLRHDPRVHRLGRFLRKTSLDELPQLFNVIAGEMSLVGPRPVTTEELHHYAQHAPTYSMMRPGITGLWQTSGRSNTSYAQRVRLDVEYFHGRSLLTDIRILLRTVNVVLFERSAH
ncbi:MAG: sugar transferase [Sulfitobacter sp.]